MSDGNWLDKAKEFMFGSSRGDAGSVQACLRLLDMTDTNINITGRTARLAIALEISYKALKDRVPKSSKEWDWIHELTTDCVLAGHNLDGKPRVQFLEGIRSEAVGLEEKRKRRMLDIGGA